MGAPTVGSKRLLWNESNFFALYLYPPLYPNSINWNTTRPSSVYLPKLSLELGMLEIDSNAVVGSGSHRICYYHPDNENLCVKIDYAPDTKASLREKQYYELLNKRRYSWRLIPRYYGSYATNLGAGDVFDLIRDENGDVSKTLSYYLMQESHSNNSALIKGFCEFKQALFADALSTHKLHPDNIAVQAQRSGFRLFLIDDIGNSEFFPISTCIRYFGARKVIRRWTRFEHLLSNTFRHSSLVDKLINSVSKGNECPMMARANKHAFHSTQTV